MNKIYVNTTLAHPYLDYIVIEEVHVVLDSHASIKVLLCDYFGSELTTINMTMSGADYDNWGAQDTPYVENWVLDQLGTSKTTVDADGYALGVYGTASDGPDGYM